MAVLRSASCGAAVLQNGGAAVLRCCGAACCGAANWRCCGTPNPELRAAVKGGRQILSPRGGPQGQVACWPRGQQPREDEIPRPGGLGSSPARMKITSPRGFRCGFWRCGARGRGAVQKKSTVKLPTDPSVCPHCQPTSSPRGSPRCIQSKRIETIHSRTSC